MKLDFFFFDGKLVSLQWLVKNVFPLNLYKCYPVTIMHFLYFIAIVGKKSIQGFHNCFFVLGLFTPKPINKIQCNKLPSEFT